MPHVLSPLVVAAAVANLVGSLLVAAIFAGLQRSFPRSYISAWSWSWLAGGVRVAAGVLSATLPPLAPASRVALTFTILAAGYLQAAWLLVGTHVAAQGAAAGPRLRRLAVLVPVLLSLGSAAVAAAGAPLPLRSLLRFLLPATAIALAAVVAGLHLWRRRVPAGAVGTRLMAGALFAYATLRLHDAGVALGSLLGYGAPGYPVYLGFADLAVLTTLGLGSVVALLEEEQGRLRLSEEKVRQSEERFARLAGATFEGVAMSENGVILDANEQLATMLGCPVAELAGRSIRDFVAEQSREVVEAHVALDSRESYTHVARRRDGSVFPVEVRARSVPYQGRSVRLSAVRDISERALAEARQRQLEADLRAAAEEWRQTFDALEIGLVLADPEGRLVRLNRKALELVQHHASFDAVVGSSLDVLASREPWRSLQRLNAGLPEAGVAVAGEARDGGSGRAYYLLASPWLRDPGQRPWSVLTFRDVTDFVGVQEQLRNARLMETMGALVAGVAHEVRNPLFSISATVDAMEAGGRPQGEFAEHLELLRSQVGRLTRLMQDLLDYGKPAELYPRPTRLESVLTRAVRACDTLAQERKVGVELSVAADLPALHADATRLEQVCQNLIANALQHSAAGSVVRVAASLDAEDAPPSILCTVEDAGPGLPPGQLARIFEPFFTRRKGGTGLGLSIVQRLVEAHGGFVRAENRESGGARFVVRLPLGGRRRPAD